MTKHDILEIGIKHCSDYSDGDFTFNDEELLWFINELSTTERLAGLNERDKWREIESVPTGFKHPYETNDPNESEGSSKFVLLCNGLHVGVGYAIIEKDFDAEEEVRYCDEHNECIDKPSHWMPLPSLPQPPNK